MPEVEWKMFESARQTPSGDRECDVCGNKIEVAAIAYVRKIEPEFSTICIECEPDMRKVIFLTTDQVLSALKFLDYVRVTGMTNMLGGDKYLQSDWAPDNLDQDLSNREALAVSVLWMKSFARRATNGKLKFK